MTFPRPEGVVTSAPRRGARCLNEVYTPCSYLRQHMRRPQQPEIFEGFSGRFWSLAMRIETGSWSPQKLAQHSRRPQGP